MLTKAIRGQRCSIVYGARRIGRVYVRPRARENWAGDGCCRTGHLDYHVWAVRSNGSSHRGKSSQLD